jgi:transposase
VPGISKAGNSWARRVLIESHGSGGSTNPTVRCLTGMPRRPRINRRGFGIMLIALARKLAISLWRYVETGLVPDGAVMAKAAPHQATAM